jgi:predicted NodU family carbamoyl transferase
MYLPNYSQMHDSSACLVRDVELLSAVAEERISRVKHDAGFPRNAIQACLDFARIGADRLDESAWLAVTRCGVSP